MAEEKYFMNKQFGRHMGAKPEPHAEPEPEHEGSSSMPHMFVHTHDKGHTVHIHHKDGRHEKHEHAHGDAEGIKAHVDEHYGQGGTAPEPVQAPEAEPEQV